MKVVYDLHIHSALSPCADNTNTPVNVVATASCMGVEMMAVSDHNAIENVLPAIEVGEALGVTVVPAIEVQTAEDIHILCLFEKYEDLEAFYNEIPFSNIKNKPEILGDQLIINSDDEITGTIDRMLLVGANISEPDVLPLVEKYGGVAIPAHINREANGIVAILGDIPPYYKVVELSADCDDEIAKIYGGKYKIIYDSDSHTLDSIGEHRHLIELKDNSIKSLLSYLKGE